MDSGLYWCGVYESSGVFPLRTIQLMVSQGVRAFPSWGKGLGRAGCLWLAEAPG